MSCRKLAKNHMWSSNFKRFRGGGGWGGAFPQAFPQASLEGKWFLSRPVSNSRLLQTLINDSSGPLIINNFEPTKCKNSQDKLAPLQGC